MEAKELKAWRERMGLTQQQVAERLGVTRTTIQNWEGGVTPIPQTVDMSCEIWEPRLKQEDPDLGPVTLVYSDGPMFVNPYGPRARLAMMHQEPYPTNTAAIARVQQLWGRPDFHNAFIIEESGRPLWNVVELKRVVDGADRTAPSLVNLVASVAKHVRANSTVFVRSGPRRPSPAEEQRRQQEIEAQADELEQLVALGVRGLVTNRLQLEDIFARLRSLGTKAPDSAVSSIAQALVVFESNGASATPKHRPEYRDFVADYKGYEISWPETRLDSSRWTVNLSSDSPHLLAKLGGGAKVFNDGHSIESAVQQAKLYVDELLADR